jgi:hypothetical protein
MPTLNKMNFLRLLDQSRAEENLCDVEFRVVDPVNKPLGTVPCLTPGVFRPLQLLCTCFKTFTFHNPAVLFFQVEKIDTIVFYAGINKFFLFSNR